MELHNDHVLEGYSEDINRPAKRHRFKVFGPPPNLLSVMSSYTSRHNAT